ncbi:MAG: Gfo/Idh/MocA family protein [Spirochaetota bacterium]
MKTVRWGIIGAGDVCERKSGPPLYKVDRSELVLVHRRDRTAGEDFARRHAGRYVGSVDELLASEEIDALYVATPHALHAEQIIAAVTRRFRGSASSSGRRRSAPSRR